MGIGKKICQLVLLVISVHTQAQSSQIPIIFSTSFNNNPYQMGTDAVIGENHIRIDKCRFYISGIALYDGSNMVWKESNSYHLVELSGNQPDIIQIPTNVKYDHIQFNLGIDSITNVAGVMGGDLDPTNGMYWTWQSGYINFKLEGYCSLCSTRNQLFEYHLGGYKYPNQSMQTLDFKVTNPSKIHLVFDLGNFFSGLDFTKSCAVMSPGTKAVELSVLAAKSFMLSTDE